MNQDALVYPSSSRAEYAPHRAVSNRCGPAAMLAGAGAVATLAPTLAQAAPAPGAIYSVAASTISAGDTAWVLISAVIVIMMTLPGLAFFYGGLVRKKNILGTMTQVFIAAVMVTVVWFLLGYGLAFGNGNPWFGSVEKALGSFMTPHGDQVAVYSLAPNIPESVFALFQAGFAIITAALIVGAFAERVKFGVVAIFCALWSLLVYAPVAHWVWHPEGWLYAMGVRDFAGGLVVHVNAGAAALACAMVIKPRRGYGREPMKPSNLAYMLIGASLLWIGWFGFNGGSALAANSIAGLASVNTQIATAVAALMFIVLEWFERGKATLVGMSTGAVAGLVAITPAAGYVGVEMSYLFGVVGGFVAYIGLVWVKPRINVDDSLDVFTIHGLVGIAGSLMTPWLSTPELVGSHGAPLAEAIGTLVVLVYSFGVSWCLMQLLSRTLGGRVSGNAEVAGLDLTQHGESLE
jgi:Amt family ammonium transporter